MAAEGDEWILQVMRKEMQRVHSELSQLRKDSSSSAVFHQVKGKAQGRLQTKDESVKATEMKSEAGEDWIEPPSFITGVPRHLVL